MITTVSKFCSERKVTHQFVYEYVRKGKFKLYETDTFAKVENEFVKLGKAKVLEVPTEYFLNNVEIDNNTKQLIMSFATHPILQELTLSLLHETDRDKRRLLRDKHDLYLSKLSTAEQEKIKAATDIFNEKLLQKAKNDVAELEAILAKE